jgi:hypothetical protein
MVTREQLAFCSLLAAALVAGAAYQPEKPDPKPVPPKPKELAPGHYAVKGEAGDGARWSITVTVRQGDGCLLVVWSNGQVGVGRPEGNTVWIGGPFGVMELKADGKQWRGRYWTGALTGVEVWTRLVEEK